MGVIDDLLANNRALAARYDRGHLDVRPSLRLAIVTCMGSRLDVFAALGPEDGPSGVTSSVTTPRALRRMCAYGSRSRSAGSVRRRSCGSTTTDCGLQLITDDGFRAELQEAAGMAPSFAIESSVDVDADPRQPIASVRHSPFLLHRDRVRGLVYDVDTGVLREIEA